MGALTDVFTMREGTSMKPRSCRVRPPAAKPVARHALLCALALSGLGLPSLTAGARLGPRSAQFQGLGKLSDGAFETQAYGVSADGADGSVVVGWAAKYAPQAWEAFRWTAADGMTGLGDLSGGQFRSGANAVSADGFVIVGLGTTGSGPSDNVLEAFRWTASGGMQGLGDLSGGNFESQAFGASADGAVVVGYGISANGQEAFRWTAAGGMQGLGDLPGGDYLSVARAVSADGSVVVGIGTWGAWWADQQYAFRWTASGGMQPLGALPGAPSQTSRAYGVSADGSVVVGWSSSPNGTYNYRAEAFRWTASDGMQGLGDLPGGYFDSWAWAASADGAVIVGTSLTELYNEASIWDAAHGMRRLADVLEAEYGLDLTGWTLEYATAISPDGQAVVGWGINPGGWREAWLAVVPPILRGDVDCDGGVGFGDINPFVLLLSDPELWQQTYPECPIRNGDINADGVVDFADINPFVDCVVNGGCTAP
jgi:probable HAF family extracellular repeat protein